MPTVGPTITAVVIHRFSVPGQEKDEAIGSQTASLRNTPYRPGLTSRRSGCSKMKLRAAGHAGLRMRVSRKSFAQLMRRRLQGIYSVQDVWTGRTEKDMVRRRFDPSNAPGRPG
jgi:hypothetical protein